MAKSYKRLIRMEQAVRLESKGIYKDVEIAAMLGVTTAGLAQIKADPDYATVRERFLNKVITALDEEIGEDVKALRARAKAAVPRALQVLIDNLDNPDPKVALRASEQILNRDGRLAEISKSSISFTETEATLGKIDEEVANKLVAAKVSAQGKQSGGTQGSSTIQ